MRLPGARPDRRQRRRWVWLVVAALTALVAVTLLWFQPQKLLYDQRVDEPAPTAGAGQTPAAELASGRFISREHATSGSAHVLPLPDGRPVVRFEGFATSNGPALVVWLSKNRAEGPDGAFDDAHVDLGPLKGNVGDQNYPVPVGVDASSYASVVVWCARFHVSFGAADLTPVPGW
jgi:hypothetical protein